ncbi:hypothetical protein [Pseudoxanthomonas mexicana]|uniref:hypothetical protein n=1 Tax=Pseudoxanthomonas mexicana TaxID=128785 RepID=UPI00398B2E3E
MEECPRPSRRHRWAALLLGAWPALAAASASPACIEALLRELGWRIEPAAEVADMHVGQPCTRASLADAHAAGDLRLLLPADIDAEGREAALRQALASEGTLCAYLFALGDSTRRATARLQDNPGYRFSALQLGWIGFGPGGARAQGWRRFRSFGRGYEPAGSNARALDAFYSGRVRSECGVGRQVAQLATQRELYGDDGFDAEFDAGELSIGTFLTLHGTDSILLGRNAGEFLADGKAARTAAMGRQAFMGAPGAIVHAYDRILLDDVHNQAENFVVADVDEAAARALEEHGGLAHYDRLNQRIWSLAREMRRGDPPDFLALLHDRDEAARAALDEADRARVAQLDALLADPFYTGFRVYVHRQGVRPIGYHVVRLLDLNPRTPYTVELMLHNLHTTLYRRWIEHRLRRCAASD